MKFIQLYLIFTCFCVLFLTLLQTINKIGSFTDISYRFVNELIINRQPSDNCVWQFEYYAPSEWELSWFNNITELQTHVCATLANLDEYNKSLAMVQRVIELQRSIFNENVSRSDADELFSNMAYRSNCSWSGLSSIVLQQIEPLIGLLRDPLTVCEIERPNLPSDLMLDLDSSLQSKRFLLLAPSAPYWNLNSTTFSIPPWIFQNHARKILLDIGSAFFNGVSETKLSGQVTSARWFYDYFRNLSISFDQIIAFEKEILSPEIFWGQIPADLLGVFTLINVGIDTNGTLNPWRTLENIAKPEDYVLIKLDIDVLELEQNLMQQIVDSPHLQGLIDEIFFEMHVLVDDMVPFWGTNLTGQLKDAYTLFSRLRQLGIRMHSWP